MDRRRPRNPPTRPLVLIVEGHVDTRGLYSLALAATGFEVVAVADGAQAFRHAWEIHPDIIVADLPMPNGDGRQFLSELRRNARTREPTRTTVRIGCNTSQRGSVRIRNVIIERSSALSGKRNLRAVRSSWRGTGSGAMIARSCIDRQLSAA